MLEIQERNMMGGERFHARQTPPAFSVPEVTAVLRPGDVLEGSFAITGADGDAVCGFVRSSQPPMQVLTKTFSGTKELIAFRLDAAGYAPGDRVDGVFRLLTNQGEYELPFHVSITGGLPVSSIGPIRSLAHFVNLARTSWREAASLFYRKEFEALTASEEAGGSVSLHTLYRGLSARQGNEHNVEEFLIAAGFKEPAVYEADCRELSAELSYREVNPQIRTIHVRRSGWGYTGMQVSVSGDFLTAGTKMLREADFIDGIAEISIAMDPVRMHAGRNYGHITLTPAFGGAQVIPVTASWYVETALRTLQRREQRRTQLQMMQDYLARRSDRLTEEEFTERMGSSVRRMQETDRLNPLSALYRIHYLLRIHQGQDALRELQALCRRQYGLDGPMPDYPMAQFDLEEDLNYAYRIYLTILCAQEVEPDTIASVGIARDGNRILESLRRRNPDSFRIAWMTLDSNPDYSRRPSEVLRILKEQFTRGCRSPLLYMELWQMIRLTPTILYELGELELQVLLFAARREMLTDAVMVRVNDLAVRRKTFSMRLFRILTMCYETQKAELRRRETLESICTLLIRGNMTDPRYHVWYRRGVEQGLTITRLLDYFMLSLPAGEAGAGQASDAGNGNRRPEETQGQSRPDGAQGQSRSDEAALPQIVLLYYSYQNTLPDVQTARLYRCVMESREENPELYARYAERIQQFTLEQLEKRRISGDLACLYEHCLLSGRILSAGHAAAAVQAVFTCRIRTEHPDMHRAVLVYDRMRPEQYCPLRDGTGYMPVYGEECRILLENDRGDRCVVSTAPEVTRLLEYAALLQPLLIYEVNNPGFDLYLTQAGTELRSGQGLVTAGNADRVQALALSPEVMEDCRLGLRRALMDYYETAGDTEGLCALLDGVNPDGMDAGARAPLLRAMASQGLHEQAYRWLVRFGTEGVDADTLLRIASGLVRERGNADTDVIAELAYASFAQGRYDRGVLQILTDEWDGSTMQLESVRRAAAGFGMDTAPLSRRMLVQLLFTGESFPETDASAPSVSDPAGSGAGADSGMSSAAGGDPADRAGNGRAELSFEANAGAGRSVLLDCCAQAGEEETFLADVLAQMSHLYFVAGADMPAREFDRIAEYGMEGVPLLDICRIAWLKDRSERSGETSDRDLEITSLFLNDLIGRNVIFPFYRQFAGTLPVLMSYADETLFEYRSGRPDPKARVLFHYAAERGGVREAYAAKEMKEMYEGVYVTGFLLFFGEQLHYYITDDAQERNIVESGTLGQDARIAASGSDRFCCINEITMLTALGRDDEAIARMDEYGRKAFLTSRLFED